MTSYSERLDGVLDSGIENIQDGVTLALRAGQNIDYHTFDAKFELKQEIASLIKELVEEAKPSKKHIGDEVAENRSYTGERLFNATINQFEQNLLKALEEK